MMIFNRKELFIGGSMKRFAEIRGILESADILYRTKVKDRYSQWSAGATRRTVVPGMEPQMLYVVYVHKNDYQRQYSLLGAILG
jgi:hypothetical protein